MLTFKEFYQICEGKKPDTPPHAVPGTYHRSDSGVQTYTLQKYEGPEGKPKKKEIEKLVLKRSGGKAVKQRLKKLAKSVKKIEEQNQGPSTPVKIDSKMGVVPNPGAGRIGQVRLKPGMIKLADERQVINPPKREIAKEDVGDAIKPENVIPLDTTSQQNLRSAMKPSGPPSMKVKQPQKTQPFSGFIKRIIQNTSNSPL